MAFIPAEIGVVRAVYFFGLQGQECLVVHYFDCGGANPSGAELLAFANDLMAAMGATMMPELSNELTLTKVVCTNVQSANGAQATSTASPIVGSVAQPSVNNALGVLVSLGTGLSGRSFRGRSFFPGARDDGVAADSNYWEPGFLGDVQTAMNAYLSAVNALTPVGATACEWVVVSYYELDPLAVPPAPRTVPRATAIDTPIISVSAKTRIATQRRRRPRS
jgi:hypothetical protein